MANPKKPVSQGTKQQKAKVLTTRQKVKESAAEVKASREAAQDLEVTTAGEWKRSVDRKPVRLMLPSGNVCEAINKGFQSFAMEGGIPNPLMPLLMEAVNTGKGLPPAAIAEMIKDEDALQNMLLMVDNVVVSSVISPAIFHAPPDILEEDENGDPVKKPGPRDPGKLYVDELDMDDKMFVMQWFMGGVKDLERFREEQASAVAALQSVGEVEQDPK